MDRIITAVCLLALATIFVSPSIGGMIMRAIPAVVVAWSGVISPAQYEAFALTFHW